MPTTPSLLRPLPDAYVGRHMAAGTLRPTFTWSAATVTDAQPISYELQLSPDASFASNAMTSKVDGTSYTPAADLAVSQVAPVGTRYYWRVRACTAVAGCGAYSKARWVNVGRNSHDFNGDGYSDVLVGAFNYSVGGTRIGRAYVYFGGAGGAFNAAPDGVMGGVVAGDQYGNSVAPAGDVNGDGYIDVLVAASLGDGDVIDSGTVSLYFGGPGVTFDTQPDAVLLGTTANARFGRQVAAAGDVNGDGYGDIVIGEHVPDPAATRPGRVYIYHGGPGAFDRTADGTLTGVAGEQFGASVASAGDLNADGYADLIVGAPFADVGTTDAGRVLVFFGGENSTFDATPDQTLSKSADVQFGYSVAAAGDLNGDGYADVAVSAPGTDATAASRAYAYYGSATGALAAEPSVTFPNAVNNEVFGRSISSAGDLNGDGVDDLIVGAYLSVSGGSRIGRVAIFYGGKGGMDTTADGALGGSADLDLMGSSVALAGDVNADGLSDIIVGVPGSDAPGLDFGRALVYFGRTGTFDTTPRGTLNGTANNETFGTVVAGLAPAQPAASRAAIRPASQAQLRALARRSSSSSPSVPRVRLAGR